MKVSHDRSPASPMRPEISCVQSFPDCLGREPSTTLSCKSVKDCLQFLCADRVKKRSSCVVIFSGRLLCGLSLTYLVIWNLASILRWYYSSLQTMLQLGFTEHQHEKTLRHRFYPDLSVEKLTDHCSRAHAHSSC